MEEAAERVQTKHYVSSLERLKMHLKLTSIQLINTFS